MPPRTKYIRALPLGQLGKWLADYSEIWQMDILDNSGLAHFSNDRGLSLSPDYVWQLWRIGLLNADLVLSSKALKLQGLMPIGTNEDGDYLYADDRRPRRRPKGWGSALEKSKRLPSVKKLYFHPFRYYVLYHIERILELSIHPLQTLICVDAYPKLLDLRINVFQQWSSTDKFLDLIRRWNDIAAIAIAVEPYIFQKIFHSIKYPVHSDYQSQRKKINLHREAVRPLIKKIGVNTLEQFRHELCFNALILDPNTGLHTVLRLMKKDSRSRFRGSLGGALHLRLMAEMLRRATEDTFQTELPEEDALGIGGEALPIGVKQEKHGTDRILDGSRVSKGAFIRRFGLDFGVHLRWYVEGDTEYGALSASIGRYTGIEVVDLRGQVAAGRGKGLSFRDDLRNNLKSHIFSFISIDQDREDYIRALREAIEGDEVCGMVFVSKPDFEFANFTLSELEEIVWQIAIEKGIVSKSRNCLHEAFVGVKSAKAFLKEVESVFPGSKIGKGRVWGEKLMEFALKNPTFENSSNQTRRPIIDARLNALRSGNMNYLQVRREFQIDPKTWKLIKRKDSD